MQESQTALFLAVEAKHFRLVEMIVIHGAELSLWMIKAVIESNDFYLIERFIDIYPVMLHHEVSLETAISCGSLPIFKLLKSHGACLPTQQTMESTARLALSRGHAVMVMYLIHHHGLDLKPVLEYLYSSPVPLIKQYLNIAAEVGEVIDVNKYGQDTLTELLPELYE